MVVLHNRGWVPNLFTVDPKHPSPILAPDRLSVPLQVPVSSLAVRSFHMKSRPARSRTDQRMLALRVSPPPKSRSTISPIGSISADCTLHPSAERSVIVTESVLPLRKQIEPAPDFRLVPAIEPSPGIRRINQFQSIARALERDHEVSPKPCAELDGWTTPKVRSTSSYESGPIAQGTIGPQERRAMSGGGFGPWFVC